MNLFYLDASALVKRHVREPGSTWVRALVDDPANVILTSAISLHHRAGSREWDYHSQQFRS